MLSFSHFRISHFHILDQPPRGLGGEVVAWLEIVHSTTTKQK